MPSILSIGTALPEFNYSTSDVEDIGKNWLKNDDLLLQQFSRFVKSSKVQNRRFVIPKEEILNLGGLRNRASIFEESGVLLGESSILDAIRNSNTQLSDLDCMVFTSCSCPTIPSIDGQLVNRLGLNRNITRVPIFQYGCAGGVAGLALASKLTESHNFVCLSSVEICSMVFQPQNFNPAQLVGSAIFADGSASVILSKIEKGLTIRATRSFLIPNSRELMGYSILDDGFHLLLDKSLPQKLIEIAPDIIESFLKENSLERTDVDYWLFHPGGIKILDFLENALEIPYEKCRWSRETLYSIGNVSSATVLFVIKRFLEETKLKKGDKVILLGIGPGLTIELILFEWA